MSLGLLTLHIKLPGCSSLKEKRSRLKPLISRLHKEFNISVAELDFQDVWQDALLGIALVSNHHSHTQRSLQVIPEWIENHWPDATVVNEKIELF